MSAPDRTDRRSLNGWKEIAAYLGKSVRSVQRWEATLGLPVRRINTPDGHIVYAEVDDIDRWRQSLDAATTEAAVSLHDPVAPDSTASARQLPVIVMRAAQALTIVAAAAVLFLAGARWGPTTGAPPSGYRLADRFLEALGPDGRVLWTHRFDRDVTALGRYGQRMLFPLVDVDGDGQREVLAFVRFAAQGRPPAISDGLFCFTQDGALKWSVIPDHTFEFNDWRASPPWTIEDFATSDTAGPRRLWIALRHHTWWPSLVLEIDGSGHTVVRYVQAGRISSLAHWVTAAGGVLAVGGTSQRFEASLALLADGDPPASFPGHVAGPYGCLDCPQSRPRRVFSFQRTELSAAFPRRHASVTGLNVSGSDLRVSLNEAVSGGVGTDALALIGPDQRPKSLSLVDAYWRIHDQLSRSGEIDHDTDECPERLRARVVREWTLEAEWREHEVPSDGAEVRP